MPDDEDRSPSPRVVRRSMDPATNDTVGRAFRRHFEQDAHLSEAGRLVNPLGDALKVLGPIGSVLAKLEASNQMQQKLALLATAAPLGTVWETWRAIRSDYPGIRGVAALGQSYSALATVKAALGNVAHLSLFPNQAWLTPLVDRNSILRLAVQNTSPPEIASVQAYAKAIQGRNLSIQDHLTSLSAQMRGFTELFDQIEEVDGSDLLAGDVQASAASGLIIGDRATAIVIHEGQTLDQQWWSSRPLIERLNTIVSLLALLVAIAAIFTSQGFTNDQAKAATDSLASITDALNKMADGERSLPADQRHDALIEAGLAEYKRRMAGRPCLVSVATSIRGHGPNGPISTSIHSGQLALCIDQRGKWIEVIFDDGEGEVSGWALKKHFRLTGEGPLAKSAVPR